MEARWASSSRLAYLLRRQTPCSARVGMRETPLTLGVCSKQTRVLRLRMLRRTVATSSTAVHSCITFIRIRSPLLVSTSVYLSLSQRISLGVVKADAAAIRSETGKRKSELVNIMGAVGARM